MRILMIEDDEELAETVAVGLRRAHLAVDVALDGTDGLARAQHNDYDVIVLDRDLPALHGDKVCSELVASRCRSRILMLTAAAGMDDLVDGLGIGADDYLPKPFNPRELAARLDAILRRTLHSPQHVAEALTAVGCPVADTHDNTLAALDHPLAALLRPLRTR